MPNVKVAKRISVLLSLLVAAVLAPANAQEPAPDPKALGLTEALFSYCAKADPPSAARYKEKIKAAEQRASDEILAKVRQSDEYLKAHAAVDDFVAKVDEHNSKKVCMEPPVKKQ